MGDEKAEENALQLVERADYKRCKVEGQEERCWVDVITLQTVISDNTHKLFITNAYHSAIFAPIAAKNPIRTNWISKTVQRINPNTIGMIDSWTKMPLDSFRIQ